MEFMVSTATRTGNAFIPQPFASAPARRPLARGRGPMGQTECMTGQRCTVVIESRDGGGSAAALPFGPKEAFGRARAPVKVTVGRHAPFRTTIASYEGKGWIGFRKAQLAEMGLRAGDQVD